MTEYIAHHSQLDHSVNFERTFEDHTGRLEARYVRRTDEYFIVYLSSQTGCKQACRMCWLTATGQTDLKNVTVAEYLEQAREVLDYYAKVGIPAERVHFNFMARGEPFANPHFIENADEILQGLADLAVYHGLKYKFLISTIFPKEFRARPLTDIFTKPSLWPELYYSVYSLETDFRRRWLPKAGAWRDAFWMLKEWQLVTGKKPKIHYAFIENENDTLAVVKGIVEALQGYQLDVNWNIVRYNSPVGHYSKEPVYGHIDYLARYIRSRLPDAKVKIIPRVGTDVQASCGTFLK